MSGRDIYWIIRIKNRLSIRFKPIGAELATVNTLAKATHYDSVDAALGLARILREDATIKEIAVTKIDFGKQVESWIWKRRCK